MQDIEDTALYRQIDNLVRHHDPGEPYLTNTVDRIYSLVKDGAPRERLNNTKAEYRRGYNNGYQTAMHKFKGTPDDTNNKRGGGDEGR